MKTLDNILIKNPEPNLEFSSSGYKTLTKAQQQKSLLRNIHSTVDNGLKNITGFSKDNIPLNFEKLDFEYGDISGRVESKPTSSVSYKPVMEELCSYLKHRKENFKLIKVKDLIGKYYSLVEDNKRETIEQKIYFDDEYSIMDEIGFSDDLLPREALFSVNMNNYQNLNKGSLLDRFKAKKMEEYLDKEIIKPFNNLIENRTLEYLGFDKDNLEETIGSTLSDGEIAIDTKIISRETVGYNAILKTLFNEQKSRKTNRSGELYSLIDDRVENTEDLDKLFERQNRNGMPYVSIESVLSRLDDIIYDNTKRSKRLEWKFNPIHDFSE